MKGSFQIARIAGIIISIHWTFFLLLIWVVFVGYRQGGEISGSLFMLAFILAIFFCVVLHELGHALTAKSFGIKTRSIVLLPIGGVAQLEEMPEKPEQELLVAFAGPLVNVAIAGVLYALMYWLQIAPLMIDTIVPSANNFIFLLFSANIFLALFNLVPAFPMDGGRMLRAILSFWINRDRATRTAAFIGQVMAFGFVILGFLYNPFLILIGMFVYFGATMEAQYVHAGFMLRDFKLKEILLSKFYSLEPGNTIGDAVKILLNVQAKDFLVMEHNAVKGTLSRDDIIRVLSEKGTETPVAEAMNRDVIAFQTEDSVEKVYREMQKGKQGIFPVFDDGQFAGAVDADNIAELLMVNDAKRLSLK